MSPEDEYIVSQVHKYLTAARMEKKVLFPRQMPEPGKMPEEQYWLLIDLSNMHSTKVILALRDYLVGGEPRVVVCERHGVNQGYFSTCLKRLLRVSRTVSGLVRYYREVSAP